MLLLSMSAPVQAQSDTTVVQSVEEVTVTAQRKYIRQETDRIVYDVQADRASQSLTVMELLRKVPLVTVDQQHHIEVKGSRDFGIFRNGLPDPVLTKNASEVLATMSAAMVKSIEVITSPGTRNDNEGTFAILNIVMTDGRQLDDLAGTVSASYTTLNQPNVSAQLTQKFDRLMLSLDGGYSNMSRRANEETTDLRRTSPSESHTMTTHQEGSAPEYVVFADINASYDIDSLNLLTASIGGFFHEQENNAHTSVHFLENGESYHFDDLMPKYYHRSWDGRLDYQHKTHREGELMTLSYMLAITRQSADENTIIKDTPTAPEQVTEYQLSSARYTEHTLQAHWLRQLGRGYEMEVGARYIDRLNKTYNLDSITPPVEPSSLYIVSYRQNTRVLGAYADYLFQRER